MTYEPPSQKFFIALTTTLTRIVSLPPNEALELQKTSPMIKDF